MSQRQDTAEGVHPSENALFGKDGSQTKAQRSEQLLRPDCPVIKRIKESDFSAEIGTESESTYWRSRLRSMSPILDLKEESSCTILPEGQCVTLVQSE